MDFCCTIQIRASILKPLSDQVVPLARQFPKLLVGTALSALLALTTSAALSQENAEQMRDRAFQGAQWVMATQAARAVAQVGARAAAGDGPLADNIRARQGVESDLTALRRQLAGPSTLDADQVDTMQAQAVALARDLDKLDADIRTHFPEYAEIANPQPLSFDQTRAFLGKGEALVLFLSGRNSTYVWAVSASGAAWHRADLSAEHLSDMIRTLRADLDPTGPARAAAPLVAAAPSPRGPSFDATTAYQLYRDLLAPVMGVLEGADHVFVVKDGPLSSLPLAVLLTNAADDNTLTGAALQQADWLVRRFALTTLPGVSSLTSIRAHDRPRQTSAGFAGFGDPVFAPQTLKTAEHAPQQTVASRTISAFFDASGTRTDAIHALSPLPGTARELRQIARLFPKDQAQVIIGADATEAAVKSTDLSGTAIVSFATHGLVTGDISGLAEPALAFTPPSNASDLDDGLLTASEASALGLNADWVILSACNTAAGDGTPGAEGLSGLARAFLFAGAQSILVSHWPVRDDVAATLTAETLRQLNDQPGLSRSEALRRAMLGVMMDGSDPTLAHPSAWAPFVVVGEGGALRQ